jgi:hypothetical protein
MTAEAGSNYFFRVGLKGLFPVKKTITAETDEEGRKNIQRARLAVASSGASVAEPQMAASRTIDSPISPDPSYDEAPPTVGPPEPPDDTTGTDLLAKIRGIISPFTLDDLNADLVIVDNSPQRPFPGIRQPSASDILYEYKARNAPDGPQSTFTFNGEKITKQTKTRTENGILYSVTVVTSRTKSRLQKDAGGIQSD